MDLSFLLNALLISLSSLLPWFWILNSNTSPYTLQLCGGLVVLYTVFKKFLPIFGHKIDPNILTILTVNSITQLLVFSTGGISSPLFFLYYFTIFAFAIIYESRQAIVTSATTVLIYLFHLRFSLDTSTIASLFSLILITPIAQLLSSTLLSSLESAGKIKILEKNIEKEETDSLLWLSTEAQPTLNSVINSITDIVIFLNSTRNEYNISQKFIDKIKKVQTDLIVLFSSSEDLEDSIKESTDSK